MIEYNLSQLYILYRLILKRLKAPEMDIQELIFLTALL